MDKWEVRRDLSGLVLTASSAHDPPYVDIDSVQPHDLPPGYQALSHFSINPRHDHVLVELLLHNNSHIHQVKLLWRDMGLATANSQFFLHHGKDLCPQCCCRMSPECKMQVPSIDGGWGAKQSDGTFSGIVSFDFLFFFS